MLPSWLRSYFISRHKTNDIPYTEAGDQQAVKRRRRGGSVWIKERRELIANCAHDEVAEYEQVTVNLTRDTEALFEAIHLIICTFEDSALAI
jgi:hypothetical protein